MKRIIVLLIILPMLYLPLALLSFEANAQDKILDSGNTLLPACKNVALFGESGSTMSRRDVDAGSVCIAYLRGFSEGGRAALLRAAGTTYGEKIMDWTEAEIAKRFRSFCMPYEVTAGQIAKIVVKYLEAHPETLHKQPMILVHAALDDAFPCK